MTRAGWHHEQPTAPTFPYDWRSQGACLGVDPETFHPVGSNALARIQTEEAKTVCRRCLVIETCLSWAIHTGQEGIWGATTEDERRGVKRRHRTRAENEARTQPTNLAYDQPKGREYTTKAVLSPGLRMGRPV